MLVSCFYRERAIWTIPFIGIKYVYFPLHPVLNSLYADQFQMINRPCLLNELLFTLFIIVKLVELCLAAHNNETDVLMFLTRQEHAVIC